MYPAHLRIAVCPRTHCWSEHVGIQRAPWHCAAGIRDWDEPPHLLGYCCGQQGTCTEQTGRVGTTVVVSHTTKAPLQLQFSGTRLCALTPPPGHTCAAHGSGHNMARLNGVPHVLLSPIPVARWVEHAPCWALVCHSMQQEYGVLQILLLVGHGCTNVAVVQDGTSAGLAAGHPSHVWLEHPPGLVLQWCGPGERF